MKLDVTFYDEKYYEGLSIKWGGELVIAFMYEDHYTLDDYNKPEFFSFNKFTEGYKCGGEYFEEAHEEMVEDTFDYYEELHYENDDIEAWL